MDQFEVKILADSFIDPEDPETRLVTFQLTYPRYIHSELMTHRVFSRNSQSSRAVPVRKLLEEAGNHHITPIHVGKHQSGMQAREEVSFDEQEQFFEDLEALAKVTCTYVNRWQQRGIAKQVVNRYLEPFIRNRVVVTSSYWGNFFSQRIHADAEPHIRKLAVMMKEAMDASESEWVDPSETGIEGYHLPYTLPADVEAAREFIKDNPKVSVEGTLMKASVARCARVSYANHEGGNDLAKDVILHDRLLQDRHMSPFEHVAWPKTINCNPTVDWSGNLSPDWVQYRKQVEHTTNMDCFE